MIFLVYFYKSVTNGPTDGPTDQQNEGAMDKRADKRTYPLIEMPHLKMH